MKKTVTICDRCDKEIHDNTDTEKTEFQKLLPRYDILKIFDNNQIYNKHITLDLCPDCRKQLEKWINNPSTEVTRNNG